MFGDDTLKQIRAITEDVVVKAVGAAVLDIKQEVWDEVEKLRTEQRELHAKGKHEKHWERVRFEVRRQILGILKLLDPDESERKE